MSATFAEVAGRPTVEDARIRLACNGTMVTADQRLPGSQIWADGIIDFGKMRVSGFGIGGAPILSMTAEKVRFGTPSLQDTAGSHTIEGTIDLLSGATHVVVRSTKPSRVFLIRLQLDCRSSPQAGH